MLAKWQQGREMLPTLLFVSFLFVQFDDDSVFFRVHGLFDRLRCAILHQEADFPCFSAADGHVVAGNVSAVALAWCQSHLRSLYKRHASTTSTTEQITWMMSNTMLMLALPCIVCYNQGRSGAFAPFPLACYRSSSCSTSFTSAAIRLISAVMSVTFAKLSSRRFCIRFMASSLLFLFLYLAEFTYRQHVRNALFR